MYLNGKQITFIVSFSAAGAQKVIIESETQMVIHLYFKLLYYIFKYMFYPSSKQKKRATDI